MGLRPEPPCSRPSKRYERRARAVSSSPCRSPRRKPATSSKKKWTSPSVRSRPSRSTPSASGTRISRRRPTTRCESCSDKAVERLMKRQHPKQAMASPEADAMTVTSDTRLTDTLRHVSHVLNGARGDYDPPIDWFKAMRFALLGEASHCTHECYRERPEVTTPL